MRLFSHVENTRNVPETCGTGARGRPKAEGEMAVKESLHAAASGQGLQSSSEVDERGDGRRAKPHRRDSEEMVERQHDICGTPAAALSSMACAAFKPVGIF